MTRKAAMNQLFNLIQDEYEIKSAGDIEAALLDMFGSFIEKALEAELGPTSWIQPLRFSKQSHFKYKKWTET